MAETVEAVLHDGSAITVTIHGDGPALLLPVRLEPYATADAETMRKWCGDPDLGPTLVGGLSASNRVIAADYEGHRMARPAPDSLTPDNLAADLLAIADAAAAVPRGLPRLAFAGADDQIDHSSQWGGVQVRIGAPLAAHQDELIAAGWDVQVLPGLDHLGAMHSSVVLPILAAWLQKVGGVK